MAIVPISERANLSQELAAVLPPEHELFAVYVSSGLSYRESARRAGFHEDNGFRLTKMPAVRARIEELVSEPAERIRAGIDAELLMLRNRAANDDLDAEGRANVESRLKLVMAHARYRGWIVNKREVRKASLNLLGKLSRAEMHEMLLEQLNVLSSGERARIEAIAAGEDEPTGSETESTRA